MQKIQKKTDNNTQYKSVKKRKIKLKVKENKNKTRLSSIFFLKIKKYMINQNINLLENIL